MKIAIAGAGGLGSNIAHNLVREGIKELFICDFDTIEKSNLNRQFYFEDQIGQYKVDALKTNLSRIDSTCKIHTKVVKVEQENLKELFDAYDIVIEAFDKAEYKRLFVTEYLNTDKLVICASGIADFDLETIKIKKFGKNCIVVGDFTKDINQFKTHATKVSCISAMMANLVLKEGKFYEKHTRS